MHKLDRAQRRALCRAALLLAKADGVTDMREDEQLERLRIEAGFDALPPAPRDVDDLLAGLDVVDTTDARHMLLIERLRVGVADGDVDDDEMEVVAAVCRRLDLSRDAFDRCRAFARRFRDLDDDGRELIASLAGDPG